MKWRYCEEPTEAAAEELHRALHEVGAERQPRLAISGGSALRAATRLMRQHPKLWSALRLTWADERCVPCADADSNRGQLLRGEDDGGWREPALHLALFEDGETFPETRVRVESAWRRDFDSGLDVVLLGMGPDGHVASLFPGQPWPAGVVGEITDSPKPPPRRVSLSRASIATASRIILVAGGEAKREALDALRNADPRLPATGLPGLLVVTDVKPHPPT